MTNVPCRQAAVAAAILVAVIAAVAGGVFGRWAIVGGAAAGGVLFVAIACARHRGRG